MPLRPVAVPLRFGWRCEAAQRIERKDEDVVQVPVWDRMRF